MAVWLRLPAGALCVGYSDDEVDGSIRTERVNRKRTLAQGIASSPSPTLRGRVEQAEMPGVIVPASVMSLPRVMKYPLGGRGPAAWPAGPDQREHSDLPAEARSSSRAGPIKRQPGVGVRLAGGRLAGYRAGSVGSRGLRSGVASRHRLAIRPQSARLERAAWRTRPHGG